MALLQNYVIGGDFLTTDILLFIRDVFIDLFELMRNTVVFEPSLLLFDFPVTVWDLSLAFFTTDVFLFFFGFLDDYDDVSVKGV